MAVELGLNFGLLGLGQLFRLFRGCRGCRTDLQEPTNPGRAGRSHCDGDGDQGRGHGGAAALLDDQAKKEGGETSTTQILLRQLHPQHAGLRRGRDFHKMMGPPAKGAPADRPQGDRRQGPRTTLGVTLTEDSGPAGLKPADQLRVDSRRRCTTHSMSGATGEADRGPVQDLARERSQAALDRARGRPTGFGQSAGQRPGRQTRSKNARPVANRLEKRPTRPAGSCWLCRSFRAWR